MTGARENACQGFEGSLTKRKNEEKSKQRK